MRARETAVGIAAGVAIGMGAIAGLGLVSQSADAQRGGAVTQADLKAANQRSSAAINGYKSINNSIGKYLAEPEQLIGAKSGPIRQDRGIGGGLPVSVLSPRSKPCLPRLSARCPPHPVPYSSSRPTRPRRAAPLTRSSRVGATNSATTRSPNAAPPPQTRRAGRCAPMAGQAVGRCRHSRCVEERSCRPGRRSVSGPCRASDVRPSAICAPWRSPCCRAEVAPGPRACSLHLAHRKAPVAGGARSRKPTFAASGTAASYCATVPVRPEVAGCFELAVRLGAGRGNREMT